MNKHRPSQNLLIRLGLLAALATSVACAHGPASLRPEEAPNFAVGPAGKGVSHAIDLEANRSAPNFSEAPARERISVDRLVMPPSVLRR